MTQSKPVLLFNDECAVCRRIATWVQKSATSKGRESRIVVQPIGDDPEALRKLDPKLDIWDAYATIHVLMPDGSMKLGGEAVAEVLRSLPNTRWFAWLFAIGLFGFRPFQLVLDLGYTILADTRPLFGCESCGTPSWVRPFVRMKQFARSLFRKRSHSPPPVTIHSTPLAVPARRSGSRT
jgi:predicted DCC family thiol-disulfide oxidoreductase YuxK